MVLEAYKEVTQAALLWGRSLMEAWHLACKYMTESKEVSMVLGAQEEYTCEKCNRSWTIEPEAGYAREHYFEEVGGDPEDLRIIQKHVRCPFCGSPKVIKCD